MDDLPVPGAASAWDTLMKIVSYNLNGEEYGFWNLAMDVAQWWHG